MVDEINNETDWLKIRMQQIPLLPSYRLWAVQKLLELFLLVDILSISYFIRASQSTVTIQTRMQTEVFGSNCLYHSIVSKELLTVLQEILFKTAIRTQKP